MIERGTTLSTGDILGRKAFSVSEGPAPNNLVWVDLRPKLREFVDYLVARSGQWTTIYDARSDGIGEPRFHSLWGELKDQLPQEWADHFLQSTWVNPEYGGPRYKGYRLAARLVDEGTVGKQGSDVPQAVLAAPHPSDVAPLQSAPDCSVKDTVQPPVTVGEVVSRMRVNLGLSQRKLAAQLGTTRTTVALVEMNHTNPSWEFIFKLYGLASVEDGRSLSMAKRATPTKRWSQHDHLGRTTASAIAIFRSFLVIEDLPPEAKDIIRVFLQRWEREIEPSVKTLLSSSVSAIRFNREIK